MTQLQVPLQYLDVSRKAIDPATQTNKIAPFGYFDSLPPPKPEQQKPLFNFEMANVRHTPSKKPGLVDISIPCVREGGRDFMVAFSMPANEAARLTEADYINITKQAFFDGTKRGTI